MGRPIGSKNSSKSPIFAFQSADNRAYFIRTQLPPDAEYTVYTQPSMYHPRINWFYLSVTLKPVQLPTAA